MVKIEFLGPIQQESITLDIKNLKELRDIIDTKDEFSNIKQWINDCAVAINNKMIDNVDVALNSGDTITLLPPVCGG